MMWMTMLSQAGNAVALAATSGGASGAASGGGGGGSLLVWGVVLLTVAVVLLFVELFVPSAGLLGLAAAGCAVGGLVCLTYENTALGVWATLGVLVATPFLIGFMLKIWPSTPIGKLMVLDDEPRRTDDDHADASHGTATAHDAATTTAELRPGAVGKAVTPLRPVGTCLIDGQRVECLADGTIIDAGTAVRVVDVDGNEVHVRAAEG